MSAEYYLDTNVFIYLFDETDDRTFSDDTNSKDNAP